MKYHMRLEAENEGTLWRMGDAERRCCVAVTAGVPSNTTEQLKKLVNAIDWCTDDLRRELPGCIYAFGYDHSAGRPYRNNSVENAKLIQAFWRSILDTLGMKKVFETGMGLEPSVHWIQQLPVQVEKITKMGTADAPNCYLECGSLSCQASHPKPHSVAFWDQSSCVLEKCKMTCPVSTLVRSSMGAP